MTQVAVHPSNGPQIGSEFTSSSSVEFKTAIGPLGLKATVLPLFWAVPSTSSHSSARKPVGWTCQGVRSWLLVSMTWVWS